MVPSRPSGASCRIPNAIVQSRRWAARSIRPAGANPSLGSAAPAFQGSSTPVPQMFPERGLRFAFALQSPAVDRTEPTQAGPFAGGQARKADARSTCYDISSDQATIAVRLRSMHLEGAPRAQRKTPLRCMRRLSSAWFNLLAMLSALTAPRPCGAAWGAGGFDSGPAEEP